MRVRWIVKFMEERYNPYVMEIQTLTIEGPKLIIPKIFHDSRGFFFETHQVERYRDAGIECNFVQDNHSYSKHGVIRGMHFQSSPGQAKLLHVVKGKIYDVIVDIRPSSPTFGHWEGVYLDDEKHHQIFVPIGFAHGFCVVSDEAHVLYKVSSLYCAETEKGFRYDDVEVGIEWPIEDPIVSDRDRMCPNFKEMSFK